MKRLATLFLVFLPTLGIEAQTKAHYTERLDSIVVDEYWMPSIENLITCKNYLKSEFIYNAEGQVEQILYYKRWDDDEGGWLPYVSFSSEKMGSGNFRKSVTTPMTNMGKSYKSGQCHTRMARSHRNQDGIMYIMKEGNKCQQPSIRRNRVCGNKQWRYMTNTTPKGTT